MSVVDPSTPGVGPAPAERAGEGTILNGLSADAARPAGAPADDTLEYTPSPRDLALRPDVFPDARRLNRDLSWLEFNARVLSQALDERIPLLERVRFLGIFTSNLDEFVMKRVGYLHKCIESGMDSGDEALGHAQMLHAVRKTFEHLEEQQAACYSRSIRPALAREGIHLLEYRETDPEERARLDEWFQRSVFPVLTPLAVDPGHRFPFISNLSANIGILLQEPGAAEPVFARVKVPPTMPQWVRIPPPPPAHGVKQRPDPGRGRFVALYDLILNSLAGLFPGLQIVEAVPFRVTRSAADEDRAAAGDDGDADNLLDFVEAELKRRRFAKVIRLEVPAEASPRLVRQLVEMLRIKPEDVDLLQGLVDFRSLYEIADLPRADLRQQPWTPVTPPRLADRTQSIFSLIREGDILVHHPYESFGDSAERFIAEAATDPHVLAIKQTIYRTSRDSPFVQHLIRAAELGKQVACLVEVRARFDEGRNVNLAQTLEKAGVHVAYGVVGLKTHCKAALVVRREKDGIRCYAHLGTGNYNPSTANLYTDLGLLTCDPHITADVVDLFNQLTGRSRKNDYRRLLVAPTGMKKTFMDLVARESLIAREHAAGLSPVGGRIIAKMNALEDAAVTNALYKASQAGVQIDLIVRGFCCLRPGVPGLSDNIRVTSVVGRFLEHSRVFHFGAGKADPLDGEWFLGSADWMYRNLEQRVEAIVPVADPEARRRLKRIFDVMLADRRNAWRLLPDGRYARMPAPRDAAPEAPEHLGTFESLMRDALASLA
ncbi:MAG: polyphosphate kinase 1 [Phycisphaerae bacterium]|nr:polyphosphate kinase 1 [Phycisphaerae bacterium]